MSVMYNFILPGVSCHRRPPGVAAGDYVSSRCSLPPAHPFQKLLF